MLTAKRKQSIFCILLICFGNSLCMQEQDNHVVCYFDSFPREIMNEMIVCSGFSTFGRLIQTSKTMYEQLSGLSVDSITLQQWYYERFLNKIIYFANKDLESIDCFVPNLVGLMKTHRPISDRAQEQIAFQQDLIQRCKITVLNISDLRCCEFQVRYNRQLMYKEMDSGIVNNWFSLLVRASEYIFLQGKNILLHPEIDPNVLQEWCSTPLEVAIENNNIDVLKKLLRHPKIDPNKKGIYSTPLEKAIEKNNIIALKELLKHSKIDPNKKGIYTPLELAIEKNNIIALKELLKHPEIDPNKKRIYTPLELAIRKNNIDVLKELLKHSKIDPNKEGYYTPIELAIRKKNIVALKELLKHSKIDPNKEGYYTPIELAIRKNNIDVLKELLKHPEIDPNKKRIYTPLELAIRKNNIDVLKELLKHPKIDPNVLQESYSTLLEVAIKKNNIVPLKELLKHPKIDPNKNGIYTPLEVAIEKNNIVPLKELLNHPRFSYWNSFKAYIALFFLNKGCSGTIVVLVLTSLILYIIAYH